MEKTELFVPHYIDACIAVKLVTRESGHEEIKKFLIERSLCFVTEFAFYETLSVLKRKWLRRDNSAVNNDQKLHFEEYRGAIAQLEAYIDGNNIEIDREFRVTDRNLICELGDLVKAHSIDYSDALQIHTVLNGKWASSEPLIAPVFVTADEGLYAASKASNLKAWHFGNEPYPFSS